VNYLSQTYEGRRHDKKIADEENPTYPKDIGVYQDTGFQGYAPDGVKTFQPQKKPKGKELTPEQKEHNRLISSIRIVIEHIIAGMKRRQSKNGQKGALFLPRMWTSSQGSRSDLGSHSLWWCMPI
jgi:hypothetical protein